MLRFLYLCSSCVCRELYVLASTFSYLSETILFTLTYSTISLLLQQDSLLASPIILDLVILTELCQRVTVRPQGEEDFQSFHSVLALLSFLCKAPLVPSGTPVINAFFRQRACIENTMRCGSVFLFWYFLTTQFGKKSNLTFYRSMIEIESFSLSFSERALASLPRTTWSWSTSCRETSCLRMPPTSTAE